MAEQDEFVLHTYAMAVQSMWPNMYGRPYINGAAMGEEKITDIIKCYTFCRIKQFG